MPRKYLCRSSLLRTFMALSDNVTWRYLQRGINKGGPTRDGRGTLASTRFRGLRPQAARPTACCTPPFMPSPQTLNRRISS